MDRPTLKCRTAGSAVTVEAKWILEYKILHFLRSIEGHHHPQKLTIETADGRSISPTQPDRAFGNGFKHRLKVKRRAADDLQNLRRSGLLLQRFGEIARALAQLVEQPRVLDGDDGLGGEILNKRDLLVCERPDLLPQNGDHTNQLVIL